MYRTRHTFHVNMNLPGDVEKLFSLLKIWRPPALFCMNALNGQDSDNIVVRAHNLVKQWNGVIIYRPFEDGEAEIWNKRTVDQHLDFLASFHAPWAIFNVGNEPTTRKPVEMKKASLWYAELARKAPTRGISVTFPGWPIAAYEKHHWYAFEEMFKAIAEQKHLKTPEGFNVVSICTHEYGHVDARYHVDNDNIYDLLTPVRARAHLFKSPQDIHDGDPTDNWLILRTEVLVDVFCEVTGIPRDQFNIDIWNGECEQDRMPNIEQDHRVLSDALDAMNGEKVYGYPKCKKVLEVLYGQPPEKTMVEIWDFMERSYPPYYRAFCHYAWTRHDSHPFYWRTRYNLEEEDGLQEAWTEHILQAPSTPPDPEEPSEDPQMPVTVDLKDYILGTGKVYVLGGLGFEVCQTQEQGGYYYQVKNSLWEQMWVSDKHLYRGKDTSPGGDQVYTLLTRLSGTNYRYGSIWAPRMMSEGQFYKRGATVLFQKKSTGADLHRYDEITHLKFVKFHPEYTFQSGVKLAHVIEMAGYGDQNGSPSLGSFETYYYAKGYGLVGWKGSAGQSYIIQDNYAPPPQREVIPWYVPVSPPPIQPQTIPTPDVTPPTPLGEGVKATLTSSYQVRRGPGTQYDRKVALPVGAHLTYYPDTSTPGGIYKWVWITSGNWEGWMAWETQFKPVILNPLPSWWPTIPQSLPVPFGTQRNTGFNNCGEAAATMGLNNWLAKYGWPGRLEVSTLITRVNNGGNYATISQLRGAVESFGLKLEYRSGGSKDANLKWVVQMIQSKIPPILLVERGKLPGTQSYYDFKGAHFVIISGFDAAGFRINDPLSLPGGEGEGLLVLPDDLDSAWRTVIGNSYSYQAVWIGT